MARLSQLPGSVHCARDFGCINNPLALLALSLICHVRVHRVRSGVLGLKVCQYIYGNVRSATDGRRVHRRGWCSKGSGVRDELAASSKI